VTGMVVHPRQPLDNTGHSRKRPQIRVETMRACPLPERSIHQLELLSFQFRLPARPARAAQRSSATPLPCSVPTAHALATDLEFASNRRKVHSAGSEPSGSAAAPMFHGLEIAPGSTGGRHASILQEEESDCHCIMRKSIEVADCGHACPDYLPGGAAVRTGPHGDPQPREIWCGEGDLNPED